MDHHQLLPDAARAGGRAREERAHHRHARRRAHRARRPRGRRAHRRRRRALRRPRGGGRRRQSKLRAQLGLEPEVKLLSITIAFGVEGELETRFWPRLPRRTRAHSRVPVRRRHLFCVDVPLGAAKAARPAQSSCASARCPPWRRRCAEPVLRARSRGPRPRVAPTIPSDHRVRGAGRGACGRRWWLRAPLTAKRHDQRHQRRADALEGARRCGRGADRPRRSAATSASADFDCMRELFTHLAARCSARPTMARRPCKTACSATGAARGRRCR